MKKRAKVLCILLTLLICSKNAASYISSVNYYHIGTEITPLSDKPVPGEKTKS